VFIINIVPLCVLVLIVRHWVAARNAYPQFFRFQHVQSGKHMAAMGVFFLLQVISHLDIVICTYNFFLNLLDWS
jgi:dolichyl-diphosphooligosaccharide---protein glycosyltransferase